MTKFEVFWDEMLRELIASPNVRKIRNWTALNGYAITGEFLSVPYKYASPGFQEEVRHLIHAQNPDDFIICSRLQAPTYAIVSKKEFEDRFVRWRSYRINGITRLHFQGDYPASPYLISLFKEFDHLTS